MMRFLVCLVAISALLSTIGARPTAAQPVLYRVSSLSGSNFFTTLPGPIHPPISQSEPAIATAIANTAGPHAIRFGSGDLVYSDMWFNTTPPGAFGVFYSSRRWRAENQAGTLGPNPSAMTSTGVANGFPPNPPHFPSSGPQPTTAFVRVKPGVAKFGGAWDLGLEFDQLLVIAKIGGGFSAGRWPVPQRVGYASGLSNGTLFTRHHPQSAVVTPVFSSTACPTTPATCPWAGSTTPVQIEQTGVRWTTGRVTVMNQLPPITMLPLSVSSVVLTGADNRSGPHLSMGTLQLVSGFNTHVRGSVPVSGMTGWRLTLTFLPEPGATLLLAGGLLGLMLGRTYFRPHS